MANKLYEESTIQALADAIRSKSGKTDLMTVSDMVTEAEDLFDAKVFIEGTATDLKIPENVTKFRDYAFYNCSNLALTSLPEGLTSIGYNAFQNCTSITTLTFEGTPRTINSSAFSGCTNLITINVPWSEGAVANAPWGATNATINYDYVEESEEEIES